jgi:uncharacterized membrane protein YedE/YeeE
MKRALASFACGLVFAVGLALSGMTQPGKVLAFLDVFGAWDPSLAFVMASALAVLFAARALTPPQPLLAPTFAALPHPSDRVDLRLVGGSAIFGIGWGLSGFCPGPAIVSIGAGTTAAAVLVPAMLAGMAAHRAFELWALRLTAAAGNPRAQDLPAEPSTLQTGCG